MHAQASRARHGAALALALALGAGPAVAQGTDISVLDRAYAAGDYKGLTQLLTAPATAETRAAQIGWERRKLDAGASVLIGYAYLDTTSRASLAAPQDAMLKRTSVVAALYLASVIVIDGQRCQDASAVAHRIDQALVQGRVAWLNLRALPPADRGAIADEVVAWEGRTAPLRKPDTVLCDSGLAAIQSGLARGTSHTVVGPNGGKTVMVDPAPDFKVAFVDEAAAALKMAEQRRQLRPSLIDIMDKVSAQPAAPPPPAATPAPAH